jgi:hypothetical protein
VNESKIQPQLHYGLDYLRGHETIHHNFGLPKHDQSQTFRTSCCSLGMIAPNMFHFDRVSLDGCRVNASVWSTPYGHHRRAAGPEQDAVRSQHHLPLLSLPRRGDGTSIIRPKKKKNAPVLEWICEKLESKDKAIDLIR